MPKTKKFQKNEIIEKAVEIVNKDGFSALNVRRIAKELGCSIQPIFHNFSTMEELNNEVYNKIYNKFECMIKEARDDNYPYLAKGIAYVQFAKEYPELYKAIFMKDYKKNIEDLISSDCGVSQNAMDVMVKNFDISESDLEDFHIQVWIYTHGLACLVATQTIKITDEEIREKLIGVVKRLFEGYKKGD